MAARTHNGGSRRIVIEVTFTAGIVFVGVGIGAAVGWPWGLATTGAILVALSVAGARLQGQERRER